MSEPKPFATWSATKYPHGDVVTLHIAGEQIINEIVDTRPPAIFGGYVKAKAETINTAHSRALAEAVGAHRATIEHLTGVLSGIEYIHMADTLRCPECDCTKDVGHEDDCALAAALRAAT